MADYLTTDTELTSVANAIRTKGGTSSALVYPDGFVTAIGNISTGTDVSDTTAAASDVRTGKYFYTSAGVKTQGSIPNGSATTPSTSITANPSISVSSSGLITATTSASQSVTPTVSAGYVSSGTAGTVTVSGSNTSQLTTQAAQTITPGTTDQTIASGKYLTGTQTILGDANLVAANIADGVTIFGISGTHSGGGGENQEAEIIAGTISGLYSSSACYKINNYAFISCTKLESVYFDVCSSIGKYAFSNCTGLLYANFPSCTYIESEAFNYCTSLQFFSAPLCKTIGDSAFNACRTLQTSAYFPECTFVGSSAFNQCYVMQEAYLPKCKQIYNYTFRNCNEMHTINLSVCSNISANAFPFASKLLSLYLLSTNVCKLSNSNAFNSTPIAGYTTQTGGVYGSIYVPASLYNTYKTSTNWAYFADRFVSV